MKRTVACDRTRGTDSLDIVLADDHGMVRDGLRSFLEELADDVNVMEAATFDEAVTAAKTAENLKLILMDLMMPGMQGLDSIGQMVQAHGGVPVVVLSGRYDRKLVLDALALGAKGYVPKTTGGAAMVNALRLVLAGETYVPASVLAGASGGEDEGASAGGTDPDGVLAKLTERELEILKLLIAGGSNKVIARQLDVQEITVKVHLSSVYRKIGVSNRAQAVRVAMEAGLSAEE